jgi:hypothetical protein
MYNEAEMRGNDCPYRKCELLLLPILENFMLHVGKVRSSHFLSGCGKTRPENGWSG